MTSKFSSSNRIEKDQKPKFERPSFKSTTLLPDALSGCENKYIHIKGDHACFRFVFKESNRMQNTTSKAIFRNKFKTTFFSSNLSPRHQIIIIVTIIKNEENWHNEDILFSCKKERKRERENPSLCRNKGEKKKERRLMRDPSVATRKLWMPGILRDKFFFSTVEGAFNGVEKRVDDGGRRY